MWWRVDSKLPNGVCLQSRFKAKMGCCLSCCCCSSRISPDDPSVTAYILTTAYARYGARVQVNYNSQSAKPVYVRSDELYFDCCSCITGGYPLQLISSIDVVRGATILVGRKGIFLNPGVRIKGSDGTTIAFSATSPEVDVFVHQLRSAVDAAKAKNTWSKLRIFLCGLYQRYHFYSQLIPN